MSIDPTKASGAHPLSGPRVDQAGGNQSTRQSGQVKPVASQGTRDASAADDQVSISAEARAASAGREGTSATGIPAERLRGILKRISSGYYDTPQVRDKIAQKLQADLGTKPAQ
jgi:anti-sigma28 factor (negative regulator of flagellin synthesis)